LSPTPKGHALIIVIRKAASADSKEFDGKGLLSGLSQIVKHMVTRHTENKGTKT